MESITIRQPDGKDMILSIENMSNKMIYTIKPGEGYPMNRISEIEARIQENTLQKERQKKYMDTITKYLGTLPPILSN